MKISCVVHTRNSAATLRRALSSVSWVDELLVVDMESQDDTVTIAKEFTQNIVSTPPIPRVDAIRNQFIASLTHEWVFVLDSDEYLAEDAAVEIRNLIARHAKSCDAIALPRFNRIAGHVMRSTGWYPDHQIRLFRKGTVRWSDTNHQLPEIVTGTHRLLELVPPHCVHIHHENYADLRQFLRRQMEYTLNDSFDTDPACFDFSEYLAQAQTTLSMRSDPEKDGDLSRALSLLLAWDSVLRGIVHWETLDRKPALNVPALPEFSSGVSKWKIQLRRWLERHHSLRFFLRRMREQFRGRILRRTRI